MTAPKVHPELQRAAAEHEAGRLAQAERLYRKYLRQRPKDVMALQLLSMVHRARGQAIKAVPILHKALEVEEASGPLWADLGLALVAARRIDEGLDALLRAAALDPGRAVIRLEVGRLLMQCGRLRDAVPHLAFAVDHAEDGDLEPLHLLAQAVNGSGVLPVDTSVAGRLVELAPDSARAHYHLGMAHHLNGDLDGAEPRFAKALEIEPDHAAAIAGMAHVIEDRGATDAAAEALRSAIDRGVESPLIADAWVRIMRRLERPSDAQPYVRKLLERRDLTPYHRAGLERRLGRLLEDEGSFDEAFGCYAQANRVVAGRFDRTAHDRAVDAVLAGAAAPEFPAPQPITSRPVFIVGMFRSGTTLTESILGSHPEVRACGERDAIERFAFDLHTRLGVDDRYPACLRQLTVELRDELRAAYVESAEGEGASVITDKMPINYRNVALITALFPEARIIHCVRDAMDTCFSCYATGFLAEHTYAGDLRDLAVVYRGYRRLMEHWRSLDGLEILDVEYESMVRDQEATTRRVLEHCGLPWDDACLRFHETDRVVRTASIDQVRTPMYTGSIGRAARFEKHLGVLRKGLGEYAEGRDRS